MGWRDPFPDPTLRDGTRGSLTLGEPEMRPAAGDGLVAATGSAVGGSWVGGGAADPVPGRAVAPGGSECPRGGGR